MCPLTKSHFISKYMFIKGAAALSRGPRTVGNSQFIYYYFISANRILMCKIRVSKSFVISHVVIVVETVASVCM